MSDQPNNPQARIDAIKARLTAATPGPWKVSTGGQKVSGLHFQGELMTCTLCGVQQQSDPKVESGWDYIELDGKGYYVCPAHRAPANATREQHAERWSEILEKLILLGRGGGH